jgi:hypothetical protein
MISIFFTKLGAQGFEGAMPIYPAIQSTVR